MIRLFVKYTLGMVKDMKIGKAAHKNWYSAEFVTDGGSLATSFNLKDHG